MKTKEILKALKKYPSFLISTHVHPDPDALSSQLAMALYLKSLGKNVVCVNDDKVPDHYKFLPGSDLIKKCSEYRPDRAAQGMIIVDCGDMDRVGSVKNLIGSQKVLINIDHHVTNTYFGDINLVAAQASSTAEIIFDILSQARFSFTRDVAELLYIGIMTDTGSFRYSGTTAHSHKVVSQLMKFPIPISSLYQQLYEDIAMDDFKKFHEIVNTIDILDQGKVVCVELPGKVLGKFSEKFDLRDKVFKYFRAIKGVEVVVIFTEQDAAQTRVNFRSQGAVDVAHLASEFHGGGHRQASGCLIGRNLKESRKLILAKIRKLLKEKR